MGNRLSRGSNERRANSMYAQLALRPTDIVIECAYPHTSDFQSLLSKIKFKGISTNRGFRYTIIFCIDSSANISPTYEMTVNGLVQCTCPLGSERNFERYQYLQNSAYFVEVKDIYENGVWRNPEIRYLFPNISGGLKKSTKRISSTGYDFFELSLNELDRTARLNRDLAHNLDCCMQKTILILRSLVLKMK